MVIPKIARGILRPRTLFVSDLDGTLLDPSSQVSTESSEMLNRAIAAGALFSVATARTPATVISLMKEVNMQLPGVVMTGAAMYDFAHSRFSRLQYMPEGLTPRLVDLYRKFNVGTFIYTFNGTRLEVFHIGELNDLEHGFISQRAHTSVKHFSVPPSGESALPRNLDNTLLLYSVQPWSCAKALYDKIVADNLPVTPLCYHDTYGEQWGQLEMFSPTANKAAAVESLASDIGADRIVAFGDNVNDLPLFELADEGIAVANAVPELKDRATDIIEANDKPSVAAHILARTQS